MAYEYGWSLSGGHESARQASATRAHVRKTRCAAAPTITRPVITYHMRRIVARLALVLCAGFISGPAAAAVIDLSSPGTGDSTPVIQAALNTLALTGGALHLRAGTYVILGRLVYESTAPLTIFGDGSASTLLVWTPPSDTPGVNVGMLNVYGVANDNASHCASVTIRDLQMDFGGHRGDPYSGQQLGIYVFNSDNVRIAFVDLHGARGELVSIGGFGSALTPGTRAWIEHGYFHDFVQDGLNPTSLDSVVAHNVIEHGDTGIETGRDGLTVTDNVIRDMTGPAIKIASVHGFTVSGNRFFECDQTNLGTLVGVINIAGGGGSDASGNGTITDNVIVNVATTPHAFMAGIAATPGTSTTPSTNLTVQGNVIAGTFRGMRFTYLTNSIITGNHITNENNGIEIPDSASVTGLDIYDNTIKGSAWADIENDSTSPRGNVVGTNHLTPGIQ